MVTRGTGTQMTQMRGIRGIGFKDWFMAGQHPAVGCCSHYQHPHQPAQAGFAQWSRGL